MPPVGYDITAYFGRGGIVHTMTEPGSWAPRLRPAMGDHTAALALLSSVLAALRLVERTGVGQVVDVSLLATAAWTMATDLAPTLVDGQDPPAQGRRARPHACTARSRPPTTVGPAVHARAALVAVVLRGGRTTAVGDRRAVRHHPRP